MPRLLRLPAGARVRLQLPQRLRSDTEAVDDQHVLRRADPRQVPAAVAGDVLPNRTMSSAVPLFLDCDPGIDDALALAYLCCQDAVDVVGNAASGVNVATEQVVENTRGWLELADRS